LKFGRIPKFEKATGRTKEITDNAILWERIELIFACLSFYYKEGREYKWQE